MPGTTAAAGLAGHEDDPVSQVDVGGLEAGQLREPQSAVQEQHDDGRVPAGREVGPGAGGEQGPQVGIRSTGVSGSPGAGVLIPAVASWSASPSLSSHRQKCRTPANHPRAVLLEWP
jgi:hypothetical protein